MAENRELTDREREILERVATGASNRQIAQQLHISSNTVKVHLRNIFEKLGASSRTEATLYAIQAGLVDGVESTLVTPARPWWQRGWVVGGGVIVLMMVALLVGLLVNRGGPPPENIVDLEQLERDRWQELAPMPTARKGLAVAAYDGKIYAIAGETEDGVTNVVERYDPATDTWETLEASKPTQVADVEVALIGGKLYVPGGKLQTGKPTNVLEVYDPDVGLWESRAPLPKALYAYGMVAFEGKLYLFGGWDGVEFIDSTYIYEPDSDVWYQGNSLSVPRGSSAVVSSSDGVFVVGGRNNEGVLDLTEYYQPSKEGASESAWTHITPMPEGLLGIRASGFADTIYVLGTDKLGENAIFLKYLPSNDSWEELQSPFDGTWRDYQTTGLGSEMYLIGGQVNEDIRSYNFRFKALYTIALPIIQ
jgi:DNA-binding CsgD family transcriptional regulator/N-acetylneuraminic acid mutarotase